MSNINVQTGILLKIAEYVSDTAEFIAGIKDTPKKEASVKKAEEISDEIKSAVETRTVELVKKAGLQADKSASIKQLMTTHEGALRVVETLTNKVASLISDIEANKRLNLGKAGEDFDFQKKSSLSSDEVWVRALLG